MLVVFIIGVGLNLNAQSFKLQLSENPLSLKVEQNLDSINTLKSLNRIRNYYILNSYLEFNIDSIIWAKDLTKAILHIGPQYKIVKFNIQIDSVETNFQNIRTKYLMNNFDSLRMAAIANEILFNLENIGYPFSQVNANCQITDINCADSYFF